MDLSIIETDIYSLAALQKHSFQENTKSLQTLKVGSEMNTVHNFYNHTLKV